ncbi:MAG: hypothetical protein ACTHL8_17765 [Burkholderiaceae bacterium]
MTSLLHTVASIAAVACGLVAASPAVAQSCAASGAAGPGCPGQGAASGPGYGPGGGPGMRGGMMGGGMMRGGRWGQDYTPGWTMMTPAERDDHRRTMASFRNYEDCKAYVDKVHTEMSARAQSRGRPMPATPRHDPCAGLPKSADAATKK